MKISRTAAVTPMSDVPVNPAIRTSDDFRLAQLPLNVTHVVSAVSVPQHAPEWQQWLEEIGFIPGEQVTLMARGMLGGDPLVVRVGASTFALRRAEANCIRVIPAALSDASPAVPPMATTCTVSGTVA